MKKLLSILCLVLLVSCSDSPTVTSDELYKRDGVYYRTFTEEPFTGSLIEFHNSNGGLFKKGSFKNGKPEGSYIEYGVEGKIRVKGDYKNGLKQGYWIEKRGQTGWGEGPYLNDQKNGCWKYEYDLGVWFKESGCYFEGLKDGLWTNNITEDQYWILGERGNFDDQSTSVTVE